MDAVAAIILTWYRENKRSLPWRATRDPYTIWVSEMILQQTRVIQGLPYFDAFMKKFPTLAQFAEASEDSVMHVWQGLGYYSRARYMMETARHLSQTDHHQFPKTYQELLKLKGIGKYTAAAIASFCFDEPVAVVDGNVMRVMARYFGVRIPASSSGGRKAIDRMVQELLPHDQAGEFNQAIMEFGAIQCKPLPDCEACVLASGCYAFRNDCVRALPVKKQKPPLMNRYFNFLVFKLGDRKYLQKRVPGDIWEGLYCFPIVEDIKILTIAEVQHHPYFEKLANGMGYKFVAISKVYKHLLTHQRIFACFFTIDLTGPLIERSLVLTATQKELSLAVPKLVDKFLTD